MAFTDPTGSSHKFLKDASLLYQDICPEQSRFLMGRHQRMKAPAKSHPVPEEELCPFCFQWRRPDNHRTRLRPKRCASVRVQSVLRREAKGKRLSLAQMDILRRFRGSSSAMVTTCHTCNNTSKHNGVNRNFMATLSKSHCTPWSAGKHKTPQSTNRTNAMGIPKSASKDKTPWSTPRSTSETTGSSSASKSASVKKSAFSRLKRFLMLEDNQKTKTKGGLKDFLSSL
ncbi:UPF0711 protein C18orf21 homolog [Salmo salar]|uniref:UPF0711 protein C18orf21 homolog n=1 Tax=Salmo salar TaxID=8030 RepID=A0A1S3Q3M4_SALSA|nr:UPF0711 protein C18orf21 homolog [Salmo salar]|eukprot:XP_014034009.1 PREDICTED: UPF0711 protein C18orf21 homolog [Salmo salar]